MVMEKEFYFGLVVVVFIFWQCGKNFFDVFDVDYVNFIKEDYIKIIYSDMDKNGQLYIVLIIELYIQYFSGDDYIIK